MLLIMASTATASPYYSYMKDYWNGYGLDTHLDMMVTVSDLKRMADYDLAVLSAHGAYYTYEYGWLWQKAGHRAYHPAAGKSILERPALRLGAA